MFPLFKKDESVKPRFLFTQQHRDQQLEWNDEIVLHKLFTGDKTVSPEALIVTVARLMVDEKNQPIPEEKAVKILGKMKKPDREETFAKLIEAVKDEFLPNPTGGDSSLPSKVGQETATPPNG